MEDKNGDLGVAFFIFCLVGIIHNTFAPREIRQELNDYSIKFYGIVMLLVAIYFAYLLLIKDKIEKRRERKAKEEIERWQRENRERVEKYRREKEKREG